MNAFAKTLTVTIDCGIGEIKYLEPDNLLLQQLMESLTDAIQKHGAKVIHNTLQKLS